MRERYDVIVVGARVGGSALTALLGDQGVSVPASRPCAVSELAPITRPSAMPLT
jgi:hypothetical protein